MQPLNVLSAVSCALLLATAAAAAAPESKVSVKPHPGIGKPLTSGFDPGSPVDRVTPTKEKPAPSDGTGAFRTVCTPTHMAYDDPIVYPGQPGASHLHVFFGNTAVDARSTAESVASSGRSSCRGGTINRSAYWVPAMVDVRTDMALMPKESHFYYKTGYNISDPAVVQPFPAGLRIVAGDAKNTQQPKYGAPFRYNCSVSLASAGLAIPNCPVGEDLVMNLTFPQCWDGKNLDSPDHQSHMAYPSNGRCPRTHPVTLAEISYHIAYEVKQADETRNWRLASDTPGAPAGTSAHGDWINGWNTDAMDAWVKGCLRPALDCHSALLGDGRAMN